MFGDFDRGILEQVSHRPWPMPDMPWIMTQTWNDLLFAHWRVDAATLASIVPAPLEVETFEGDAWIGVVAFRMTNVAPRGVPAVPFVSAFPELNVRTYVRVAGKPGVYFFSLDAGSALAVGAARTLFGLPYHTATMDVREAEGAIAYRSARTGAAGPAEFVATYEPAGRVYFAREGTLDYFLTERYCLYTVSDGAFRLDIHHPPWPLQRAEAAIHRNTMADGLGIRLPPDAPLLHFAKRQDVVAWPLARVSTRSA
jgi:hypothetical protein